MTALTRDDAAVFRTSEDRAIVATVDFFAPVVDDAYTFGSIAAANALSDLYAMGATPLFTLNLVAWPRDPELLGLLAATVKGGVDKVREAGAFVLGGHSIDDQEPKFGMVAVGEAAAEEIVTNAGARAGDVLVLTKPIGTGILSTGLKRGLISEGDMAAAVESMATLNAGAMRAMRQAGGVHAATDVTGFGLLGHLATMLEASGVAARIFAGAVPVFDRVHELIEREAVPGGTVRNLEAAAKVTRWADDVSDEIKTLLCDAQTSGGLLMAVDKERLDDLLGALDEYATPAVAVVGEILEGAQPTIEVTHEAP